MARPARVRIRSRKPWVFARRRLFGWKVRLLTVSLHHIGVAARATRRQQQKFGQHRRWPLKKNGTRELNGTDRTLPRSNRRTVTGYKPATVDCRNETDSTTRRPTHRNRDFRAQWHCGLSAHAVRLSARTNPLSDLNRAPSQPQGRGAESSLHTLWITVWIIRKGDRVSNAARSARSAVAHGGRTSWSRRREGVDVSGGRVGRPCRRMEPRDHSTR